MHEHARDGAMVPEGHVIVPECATHPRFPGQMLPVVDVETTADGRVKLALEYFEEREEWEIGDDGFPAPVTYTDRKISWVLRDKVMCSPITTAIKPGRERHARGRYKGGADQGAWAGLVRAGKLAAVEGHK